MTHNKLKNIFKFSMLASLGAILSLSCFSAQAALYIYNNSNLDKISVKCGTVPGVPITKKQNVKLEWRTIKAILNNKTSGTCDFFQANKHLAVATLEMNPNLQSAKISHYQLDADAPLKVSVTPGVGIENTDVFAFISDN